jgi:hypothetical protein
MQKSALSPAPQPPPKTDGALTARNVAAHAFRSVLSLDPLIDYWRKTVAPGSSFMSELFGRIEEKLALVPGLMGEIGDPALLETHADLVRALMAVAFPAATWQTHLICAATPYTHRPFFYTPAMKRMMIGEDGQFKGTIKDSGSDYQHYRWLRTYWQILEKIYGIAHGRNAPVVRIVPDPETGLDRYFRILHDWQFLDVRAIGEPRALTNEERRQIVDHIDNPGMLARLIPPQKFEFRGFGIVQAIDVTEGEVLSALEKDLIDQETIYSSQGFSRLQLRLRTLFSRPDLRIGMGALIDDQLLVLNDCERNGNARCLFHNSTHLPVRELEASFWVKAVTRGETVCIADLRSEQLPCDPEKDLLDAGMRSLLIAPLFYQGETLGALQLLSPRPDDFGARDRLLARTLAPLFAMAVKRGLEEMNSEVQCIIKEKCTAVHHSVEWRFRRAALRQMEQKRQGRTVDLEPIVFKEVVPFFGQSDIRGSAEIRAHCIQADLVEQLTLAQGVMDCAVQARDWPLIKALRHRLKARIDNIGKSGGADPASDIFDFLRDEIENSFDDLYRLGPRVAQAVTRYRQALDPQTGTVARKRKEFETSVAMLNERLSAYLDQLEETAQKDFAHYFEKHQADGIDYVIFMGAALSENGHFSSFQLRSMVLWQMILACGLARQAALIKPKLAVPLDTCQLIFYNPKPLTIRFRYDEKRFDVDGASDAHLEALKSRLDKAMVKGGRERLTQPGRLAVVYTHPDEGRELMQYAGYLQAEGYFQKEAEFIDLEELPGVRGLKALRLDIQLEGQIAANSADPMAP